jgi:hypothetical protein
MFSLRILRLFCLTTLIFTFFSLNNYRVYADIPGDNYDRSLSNAEEGLSFYKPEKIRDVTQLTVGTIPDVPELPPVPESWTWNVNQLGIEYESPSKNVHYIHTVDGAKHLGYATDGTILYEDPLNRNGGHSGWFDKETEGMPYVIKQYDDFKQMDVGYMSSEPIRIQTYGGNQGGVAVITDKETGTLLDSVDYAPDSGIDKSISDYYR